MPSRRSSLTDRTHHGASWTASDRLRLLMALGQDGKHCTVDTDLLI
jgi:hypothetical protein